LTACACGESTGEKRERAVEPFADYKPSLFPTMSKGDIFDDLDDDVDKEILTGMNLAALDYDLKLCREHGTYVSTETLAFAIHHVLQDDTEELIKHLSALVAKGKRERE
jgi:hypothetical protein